MMTSYLSIASAAPIDGSALYRRFVLASERAGLRRIRFHDLRHSFGTMAVRDFPITDVQEWMGHADIATTRKYVHYAPRPDAAARLGALAMEGDCVAAKGITTARPRSFGGNLGGPHEARSMCGALIGSSRAVCSMPEEGLEPPTRGL